MFGRELDNSAVVPRMLKQNKEHFEYEVQDC
jgi:hypothetical protein